MHFKYCNNTLLNNSIEKYNKTEESSSNMILLKKDKINFGWVFFYFM